MTSRAPTRAETEEDEFFKKYEPSTLPRQLYAKNIATLDRGWAGTREVVISARLTQDLPRAVDYGFLDYIVRLGCM